MFTRIIMILIVVGFLLGLALTGSDFVNPFSSIARLLREQLEMQQLDQQNAIDLQQYETLENARTQAAVYKLEDDTQYQRQSHAQALEQSQQAFEREQRQAQKLASLELKLRQAGGFAAIGVIGILLIVFSIGLSVRIARQRPERTVYTDKQANNLETTHQVADRKDSVHTTAPVDVCTREGWRHERELARQCEREMRQQEIELQKRLSELCGTPIGSNGRQVSEASFSVPSSPYNFTIDTQRNNTIQLTNNLVSNKELGRVIIGGTATA